ncbi:endolytic transglycosylase MltG [Anaeromicrobium sediminis]|uniref:Endolytic murein transglycosylase n=1 Tax=Anaeromicrobium sediminis TaxID=1478221 RepID=A0A267MGA1_9FIRM|nr:endolytic transglycosylase MltG [Anaeromicrobium sediminis]PAB58614.1 hypothetical protein CCE28_14110 [Anaeromicrobium sediminis]
MKKKIFIGILIICCIISFSIYKIYNFTINEKETVIYIKEGSSLWEVSRNLKENNIISSDKYFVLYAKLKGFEKKIKTGKYSLPGKIKLQELLEILEKPSVEYVVMTFPEGYNLYQIAFKLEKNNLVNKEKFINAGLDILNKNTMVMEREYVFYQLEGYLFPDTYHIPIGSSEEDIINTMFNKLQDVFSQEHRMRAEELGLTINEIITIASLIEKEAANDKERKAIGGVIYNRLKIGMPLQIDASVIYGNMKGTGNISRVTYDDLKVESKYNTYLFKGLPPGPIASPGKASIEAALYPEDNDYLYYVLGENGHVFSKTYKEHLQNVNKYIKNKTSK